LLRPGAGACWQLPSATAERSASALGRRPPRLADTGSPIFELLR
jgi:hypothetical protein